jgi:cobalt transporter subunit CbtB
MNIAILGSKSKSVSKEKIGAVLAIMLGSVFIFIIGFSHIDVMHNAAHDTRHSTAFPCH